MTAHPTGPTAAIAATLRRYAGAAGTSPLDRRTALALGGSPAALHALAALPARRRSPALVLAALHDLALAGRAPALAAAHAVADGAATADAAVATLLDLTGAVAATVAHRSPATMALARCAVLAPAVAEAASRVGAPPVGLVGLGSPTGLDLHLDRMGLRYEPGPSLGDPASPVQLSTPVVGPGRVPARELPEVVARIGVDRAPLDPTDPDDVRWLRACVAPDRPHGAAPLASALTVAAAAPPLLLRGDPLALLPEALARVPAGALPVVLTAWALSRLTPARRLELQRRLAEAAAGRTIAWVSVEGVGVAPGVPTLGDRPASGHSTLGLTVSTGTGLHATALGRCWSRGRLLSWLADA
ncbi:DUF2332 domain-containing protein [Modestobacter sp. VKM Ac-2986]|uniref:DUF2332 domain-containing protein n=1 Tax=Modestobacter sp. VKM Ac-2986 TaxID=3004140 RepID=UPI0022AB0299|nr:DUF2332 domain-containing protein [Modestobacter sp. VKM Ac-2986]MCZ2829139.1 DUF2332 domain-containing protein [Modestobacter sp. VKM Ac-2986]